MTTRNNYKIINFQYYRINSAISIEKKKKPIMPPIIPTQARIFLDLDIWQNIINTLLNLIEFFLDNYNYNKMNHQYWLASKILEDFLYS